jgi:hypothetical protein
MNSKNELNSSQHYGDINLYLCSQLKMMKFFSFFLLMMLSKNIAWEYAAVYHIDDADDKFSINLQNAANISSMVKINNRYI